MTTQTFPFRPSLLALLSAVLAVQGCSKDRSVQSDDPVAPAARAVKEEREPPPPTPFERIQAAPNLRAAFAIAKPEMVDAHDDEGKGTLLFLAWAAKSMVWSDVGVAQDESSYALVMKDADEERGKRMCVPGNLIQISVEKADVGKVHIGLLMSDAGNLYRFLGVRSSGSLVQRSRARFCGVVTGRYDYSNSGGGTGHAVKLVGMFDLPENRAGAASP